MEQLGSMAIIIGLLAQTGAMFYWGGKISAGISRLNDLGEDHEERLRKIEETVHALPCDEFASRLRGVEET